MERKKKRDGEEKLWIGVWIRENERGGEFMEDERERAGE